VKVGDYVEIIPGVHDEKMPSDGRRDGLIIEILGNNKDQAVIMFHNRSFLKFHKSQIVVCKV
tara:strand:+ start:327 stop:512 length:186 start_codon:yes stop_codon:yes gene_type:complete